jgi:hypothetical protein
MSRDYASRISRLSGTVSTERLRRLCAGQLEHIENLSLRRTPSTFVVMNSGVSKSRIRRSAMKQSKALHAVVSPGAGMQVYNTFVYGE